MPVIITACIVTVTSIIITMKRHLHQKQKMMRNKYDIIPLIVVILILISCQKVQKEPESYFAQSYCYDEELSCLIIDGKYKWVGTENGNIMRIDPNSNKAFYAKVGDTKIYYMMRINSDSMLIARRDAGVVLVKRFGSDSAIILKTYILPKKDLANSSIVQKHDFNYSTYHMYRSQTSDSVFIATSNGFFSINLKSNSNILQPLIYQGAVNKIIGHNGLLFLATDDGLYCFNPRKGALKLWGKKRIKLENMFLSPENKLYCITADSKTDRSKVLIYNLKKSDDCDTLSLDNGLLSIHFIDNRQFYIYTNKIEAYTIGKKQKLSVKAGPFNKAHQLVANDSDYIYILEDENLARIPRHQNFFESHIPISCITSKDNNSYYVIGANQLYLYSENRKYAKKINDLPIHNIISTTYDKSRNELWAITSNSVVKSKDDFNNYTLYDTKTNENKTGNTFISSRGDNIYLGNRVSLYKWSRDSSRFFISDPLYPDLYPTSYCASTHGIIIGTLNLGAFTVAPSGKLIPTYSDSIQHILYPNIHMQHILHIDTIGESYLLTAKEGLLLADVHGIRLLRKHEQNNHYRSALCSGKTVIAIKSKGFDLFDFKNRELNPITLNNYLSIHFNANAASWVNDSVIIMGTDVGLLRIDTKKPKVSGFIPFIYLQNQEKKTLLIISISLLILSLILGVKVRHEWKKRLKSQVWCQEHKSLIKDFLGKSDIKLYYTSQEIEQIRNDIQEIKEEERKGITNRLINILKSYENKEKEYEERKQNRQKDINRLKKEYQFYFNSGEYDLKANIFSDIESATSYNEFNCLQEEIANTICNATKKRIEQELDIINKEIKEILEKYNIETEKKDKFKKDINSFYDSYMMEFNLIEDKEEESDIYITFLIMLLAGYKEEPLFIARLHYQNNEKSDKERWRGTIRQRLFRYSSKLKDKLNNSEYPNHYLIVTLRKNLLSENKHYPNMLK